MYCYQELIDNIQKASIPSLLTNIPPKVVCYIGFPVSDDTELVFWCIGRNSGISGDCRLEYGLYQTCPLGHIMIFMGPGHFCACGPFLQLTT